LKMDSADYTPDSASRRRADELASNLMAQVREGRFRRERQRNQSNVPLSDVIYNLERLSLLLAYSRSTDFPLPCLQINGTLVAIDLISEILPSRHLSVSLDFLVDSQWLYYLFRRMSRRGWEFNDEGVISVSPFEVEESTRVSLSSFLAYRIAGIGDTPSDTGGVFAFNLPAAPTTYLTVKVSTANPGLQLSAAPAYFINWMYFGAPTSPVTGYLLPGMYIFGGSGPLQPKFKFDPTPIAIPPYLNPTLTNI
jgi:hypothetical protein